MRGTKVSLHKGNPLAGDDADLGKWCAAIEIERDRGYTRIPRLVYVDPVKTYRVSMRVMTESKITATIGGYVRGADNQQLKTADGRRTWEHRMAMYGPTEGWQTLEITIGPAGGGTDFAWPDGALCTWLHFHFSGESGTVYVDDIVFGEE